MTFRDPKLARYNRVHVSFNDYEIEWLETLLHESGGELARLVHDLAVAQLERYAEQYGLSLDAAVKELYEAMKRTEPDTERPH